MSWPSPYQEIVSQKCWKDGSHSTNSMSTLLKNVNHFFQAREPASHFPILWPQTAPVSNWWNKISN